MRKNTQFRVLHLRSWLIMLLLFVMAGCSHQVRETPVDPRPELAVEEECSTLSGAYSTLPKIHGTGKTEGIPLLAYTLLPASPALAGVDKVTLEVDPEHFKVSAFAGDVPVASHDYQAKQGIFECIAGSLEFRPGEKPGAAAASDVPGVEWKTIRLRRTVGGSLLMQKADGLASMAFLLFPLYLSDEDWYLFEALE